MGLSGIFGLHTLGRPQTDPGWEPEVERKLKVLSVMDDDFIVWSSLSSLLLRYKLVVIAVLIIFHLVRS